MGAYGRVRVFSRLGPGSLTKCPRNCRVLVCGLSPSSRWTTFCRGRCGSPLSERLGRQFLEAELAFSLRLAPAGASAVRVEMKSWLVA